MASHLRSAQQAIKAELAHAIKGKDFYASRVEALQNALEQLENADSVKISPMGAGRRRKAASPGKTARRARKAPAATSAKRAAKKIAAAPASTAAKQKGTGSLPATGGDFWLNLITEQPQSAAQISHAAISAVGVPLSKEQVTKLKQRATPTLNTLVASQKIRDMGAGRERRFFKTTH